MFSRTRKPQSVDTSNYSGINDFDAGTATTTNGGNGANSYIIPPNRAGKKYNMNDVFQVWYETKDTILHGKSLPVNNGENYKLAKPSQIYHLELQSYDDAPRGGGGKIDSSAKTTFSTGVSGVDSSLSNLSLTDGNELGTNIGAEIKSSSNHKVPPPGMFAKETTPNSHPSGVNIITSDKIEWHYIDPSGNEQGPFNGDMMQDWLTEGYLNFDLRIRRKEDVNYHTLKEFCDQVHNYVQPFKIPLPDLSSQQDQILHQQQSQQLQQGLQNGLQNGQAHHVADTGLNATGVPSNGGHDLLFSQPLASQSLHQQFSSQSLGNQSISNQTLSGHGGQSMHPQQSQFHQFVSNGPGNLGAANMRLNSSLTPQSNLFGNDFIGDPFAPSPSSFAGGNQFGIDAMNHGNMAGFNNLQHHINPMPSLLQQQIQAQHQQPSLSRTSSGWATSLESQSNLIGTPGSSVSVQQTLSQQIPQPAPISPWLSGTQSLSRVSSPFIPTSNLSSGPTEDTNEVRDIGRKDSVLEELHSSVVTDILSDDEDKFNQQNDPLRSQVDATAAEIPYKSTLPSEDPFKSIPDHEEIVQLPHEIETEEPQYKQLPTKPTPEVINQATNPATNQTITQDQKQSTTTQQKLAPWAAVNQDAEKPVLSFKEIQKLEAENLEKQKQIEQQIRAEQTAKLWASEQEPEKASELPLSASGWATSTQDLPPTKTLAEIQKEEAEAAAAKAKAAKTSTTAASSSASKFSFASTIANSTAKDDGAWVTVAPKKPVVKKPSGQSVITNSASSAVASPQLLRSVSASRTTTTNANASAIRSEFLVWARSAMSNLYPTVSKDDLLDMFITLPSNSPDSAQLISETIYSSSAIMDGRRYAQEFLKRRQQVDKQIGTSDEADWSAAIISSADKSSTVDEDGWSTSVKSKKKGKKF
jgi:PERQ amino acid-rich with GYF domain-containing protein